MKNLNNTPENLIENGLNLSQLNQYMNKKNIDCTASSPFLLSQTHARLITKLIKTFKLPSDIFNINVSWWLRSHGFYDDYATFVTATGDVYTHGDPVSFHYGIRPAFNIKKSRGLYLELGDKVNVAGIPCTVVLIKMDKYVVLCDDFLFKSHFNKDPRKGNDYETSDVKQELENYFKDKDLKVEIIKTQSLDEILYGVSPELTNLKLGQETPNGR